MFVDGIIWEDKHNWPVPVSCLCLYKLYKQLIYSIFHFIIQFVNLLVASKFSFSFICHLQLFKFVKTGIY